MPQNNAKIGGILSIVAGSMGVLSSLAIILFSVFLGFMMGGEVYYDNYYAPDNMLSIMMVIYIIGGVIGLIVSVLAVTGGIFGLRKKNWGLALAGAIAGVLAFFPCGVVAVVFISMSKPEFDLAKVSSAPPAL